MPHNRGTRHKPKYVGLVSYRGRTKWVGTHSNIAAYKAAEQQRLAELREEVDADDRLRAPTVLEFAGAKIDQKTGRIEMTWPDGQRAHKEEGRKESSIRHLRDGLKPFLLEYGDRPLDSFTRSEALTWILPKGANIQQSVRQFLNHALDRDLIDRNHFTRLGISKHKRRVDRPDFEIITDDQYERLRKCARASRVDDYGLVIEGTILAVGDAAIRPGEIFALHHDEVDFSENVIHINWQLDSLTKKRVSPKDDDPRWVVMSPLLRDHLRAMPRYSDKILFPAIRGGYMTQSNWTHYWHAVRASAGMPGQEFYELKHRAIQWMIDPVDDGGLGLDFQTVATMVGHDDGGYLISTVYTKLSERRARDRAQRAMDAYQQRIQGPAKQRPKLTIVG